MNKDKNGENSEHVKNVTITLLTGFFLPLGVTLCANHFSQRSTDHDKLTEVVKEQDGINGDITEIKATLKDMQTDMKNNKDDIDTKIKEQSTSVSDLQGQFRQMNEEQKNAAIVLLPNNALSSSLSLSSTTNSDIHGGTIGVITAKATDIAATSRSGDSYFTFKDLVSKKMVIPFKTCKDETAYFCGQYNEKMHWDGDCVINVYKGNKLSFITEATYVDGALISYLQVFNDDGRWNASRRFVDSGKNYGETVCFNKKEDFIKNFKDSEVTGSDLYLADEFITKFISYNDTKNIRSFYKGYTSGGHYNDKTGDAYYIRFDDDGKVLTLYRGGFKDGNFDDDSGNAWEITRKAKDPAKQDKMRYMYYHGKFKGGQYADNKKAKGNLSQKEIDKIINNCMFDFKPEWKEFSE